MPATLPCDICHQENAALIVGDVSTGAQVCVGLECLPMWHLARAEELLTFEGMAEIMAARIAASQPPPEEEPAKPRRGKRPSPAEVERAANEPAGEPPAEATAAASDG